MLANPTHRAAQAADALIVPLAQAERDYPLQRRPGKPWRLFLARTLPAPVQATLRQVERSGSISRPRTAAPEPSRHSWH